MNLVLNLETSCAYLHCSNLFTKVGKKKFCSKQCQQNSWVHDHRDRVTSRRRSNKESDILGNVRRRANRDGIQFNLTEEDIAIPSHCPVLGIELNWHHEKKGFHPDSPSVDRIRPELGYTKGNVRIISNRANLLKNDATVEELTKVLEDLHALGI